MSQHTSEMPICTGYLRSDGRKGIRNRLLVLYTVDCASLVAERVVTALRREGIDADLVGTRICFDNQDMIRRLLAFCIHPNVGGVLVIGFGCEYIQASRICTFAAESGRPASWFLVQEHGGTRGSIAFGVHQGKTLWERMRRQEQATDFYPSDLCIAMECGGSDFTSGLTANTLLGSVSDWLVAHGGSSVFEEPGEMLGLQAYLHGRAADASAAAQIDGLFDKIDSYSRESGMFHISPGNFRGGLSSIEEKSIGAVCKSGSAPIQGVVKVAQRLPHSGLWIMDRLQDRHFGIGANVAADAGALMNLITLGCQVCLLSTGRGHVVGTPIAPTIKLTGNSKTFAAMGDDLDFDAHELLFGKNRLPQLRDRFLNLLFAVCRGEQTRAEQLGHYEYEMLPSFQDFAAAPSAGCRAELT